MAMSKETKLAIQAKLRLGSTPKEVAEQFDVGIQTVYGINKLLGDVKEEEMVQDLHDLPVEVIAHVIDEAKKELPMPTPGEPAPMIEAFDALSAGADGLKKLDMSFQTTMTNVLNRFNLMLMEKDLPLKDVKLIADTTASAYEKIFSSGTNIHIGDNNSHSSQNLTIFKNKQGV